MTIEILRRMFEGKPEKSKAVLKGNCSDCGSEISIEITATSGGYGLLGGALFKCSPDGYEMKCSACYSKTNR